MFPWLWIFAPQIHFPFSGGVVQDIDPTTTLLAALLYPAAGNPSKVLDIADSSAKLAAALSSLAQLQTQFDKPLSQQEKDAFDTVSDLQQRLAGIKGRQGTLLVWQPPAAG